MNAARRLYNAVVLPELGIHAVDVYGAAASTSPRELRYVVSVVPMSDGDERRVCRLCCHDDVDNDITLADWITTDEDKEPAARAFMENVVLMFMAGGQHDPV